jgi:hypothetical protein
MHELITEMVCNETRPLNSVSEVNKQENELNCQYRPCTGVYINAYTWQLTTLRLFWGLM